MDALRELNRQYDRQLMFKREEVERYLATLPEAYETAFQAERKGTAHAVMQARGFLERHRDRDVLILNGDAPFLDEETIRKAYRRHREGNHAVTLISAYLDDPFGYGRVLRDEGTGRMAAVVEEKDADAAQKRIREVSSGAYWFQVEKLLGVLSSIGNHNAQGEYYLPDAVKLLLERGEAADACPAESADAVLGANDAAQLEALNQIARQKGYQ